MSSSKNLTPVLPVWCGATFQASLVFKDGLFLMPRSGQDSMYLVGDSIGSVDLFEFVHVSFGDVEFGAAVAVFADRELLIFV